MTLVGTSAQCGHHHAGAHRGRTSTSAAGHRQVSSAHRDEPDLLVRLVGAREAAGEQVTLEVVEPQHAGPVLLRGGDEASGPSGTTQTWRGRRSRRVSYAKRVFPAVESPTSRMNPPDARASASSAERSRRTNGGTRSTRPSSRVTAAGWTPSRIGSVMRCGAFLDRETYVMLPRVDGQLAGDHPLSVVRTFAPKSRADAEVAVVGALLRFSQ